MKRRPWFCLVLVPALAVSLLHGPPPAAAGTVAGTVRGCVTLPGQSTYLGVAALWPAGDGQSPPDPRLAIRPPCTSAPLGEDGCFALDAAPGRYFVGAVVRRSGQRWQGPPQPGDRVFLSPDAAGGNLEVTVTAGSNLDIGRHENGWDYAGFTAATGPYITGRVRDRDGNPLAGLLVFAFPDEELSGNPVAVAEPTDQDGRYRLRLPDTGTIYLRVREHYGRRSPAEGGYMGVYGGETAMPVTIGESGIDQPLDLTAILIPPAANRRKDSIPVSTDQTARPK